MPASHTIDPVAAPQRSAAAAPLPMDQAALDAMPFPLSLFTIDGIVVAANELSEQLFRVPKSAVLGQFNILEANSLLDEQSRALFLAAVVGQRGQAPPSYYSFSFPGTQHAERTGCWIETSYLPFRNDAGLVTHVGAMTHDVTDRVEAEQRSAMLNTLIENARDGIGVTDAAGRIIYSNAAFQQLTGYGDALHGMSIAEIHPDDAASVEAAAALVLQQGHWSGQLGARRADGSTIPVEVSAFLLNDSAGAPSGMGAIIRNVSERYAQERRLRTFEALVENAAIGMAVTDLQGTYTYANAHLREVFGYGESMVGMHIPQLLPPDALETFAPLMEGLFATGRMSVESHFICRDGSMRPIAVAALLIKGADGAPLATAAVIRDLTEDHAREQDQHRREEELRTFKAMVENAPDSIGIADLNGVYRYTNPAYQAMLGYDHDLIGMNGFQFIAADDLPHVNAALADLSEQRVGHFQARYRRRDGSTFPAAATVFLQEAPNGAQQLIGFVRDVSEQQRAEQERATLQEQVITAQQAAIRELSTPLIPIAQGVVAMPLIGTIDTNRARLVIETLLSGVSELRAHTTILDITGVPIVDTQVANALLQAAQAVKLLGARVILTGIRPEVAQTLVGLGVDLSGIVTRGTLQSGIADALERVLTPSQRN